MKQTRKWASGLALALALTSGCLVKKSTYDHALHRISDLEGQLAEEQKQRLDREERIKSLEGELDKLRGEYDATSRTNKDELERIKGEQQATEAELTELRKQRDAQEQRLAAYRKLQERFRALVDSGKLEIGFRNGQMVVKLPSSILFPSGSDTLSASGQSALADVTKILLEFKDRRFLIAGHTDNVPIKTRQFRNNWVLSTARAVSVVEFMIAQGMPPTQVAAAGYGEEDPVAPNDSDANRELNRRIEIILVPNLSELPQLTTDQPDPGSSGSSSSGSSGSSSSGSSSAGSSSSGSDQPVTQP
ncbi:MAG TPA: OmpA family protein [Kofleriaceae bacterium]|nr:OmpA family protein [Kofleriaceae bacterium]